MHWQRIRGGSLVFGTAISVALLAAACAAPAPTPTPQRPPAAGQPLASEKPAAKPEAAKPGGAPAAPAAGGAGSADNGKKLFVGKGCIACHKAPGIPEAVGTIGADLAGIASKPKIPTASGELQNTPENMQKWITNPPAIKASTQMPPLGLTESEAKDLVAYLLTLK